MDEKLLHHAHWIKGNKIKQKKYVSHISMVLLSSKSVFVVIIIVVDVVAAFVFYEKKVR